MILCQQWALCWLHDCTLISLPLIDPPVTNRPHLHLVSVSGDQIHKTFYAPITTTCDQITWGGWLYHLTAGTHLYPDSFLCVYGDIAWRRCLHFWCEVFGGVLCGLCFRHDEQCFYCDSFLNNFSSSWKTNTICASTAISNMKGSDCAPWMDEALLTWSWSRSEVVIIFGVTSWPGLLQV